MFCSTIRSQEFQSSGYERIDYCARDRCACPLVPIHVHSTLVRRVERVLLSPRNCCHLPVLLSGLLSKESKHHQHPGLSSRRATWLVLHRPEKCSAQDQRTLDLVKQAHPQVRVACELAQAFAQMIRKSNASALESWLEGASACGVQELRTSAAGIKRDKASILAALTYEWSRELISESCGPNGRLLGPKG